MNPRVLMALVLLCVFALGGLVLIARERAQPRPTVTSGGASKFQGALLPKGLRAPDFDLRDQDGKRVSMRSLRGRPVVVTFLYTSCEDTCPAQAQTVKGALDELGHDLPALAVAVDPPRDTQRKARAFLAKQGMPGRLRFVLGSKPQLAPLWRGYAIQPQSVTQEHQARFTLVDARGFQRVGYPGQEATPERLAHDLRLLEREARG